MKETSYGKSTANHYQVLIAGGGFAGAYCGKYLALGLGANSSTEAALVADQNVLAFQPMLAEVVGASLSASDVTTPLHLFCRGTNVLQGKIVDINLDDRAVTIDAGHFTPNCVITFDHLVLALGNVIDLSRVPGMSEHGYILKDAFDAMNLRVAIISRLEEANLTDNIDERRRLLSFVVVGGGYSGVETAGQILDLVTDILPLYLNLANMKPRVCLVQSRDHILPEIGTKLGEYAQKKLQERGMEIILNDRVIAVTSGKATLGSGKTIDTHLVVSTIGNATHPMISQLIQKYKLENLNGRIITEPTMRVKGQEKLWAIGDCAAVPMDGQPSVPATAQFALRQGMQLAKNIVRSLRGEPLLPFKHKNQGQLASIGHHAAVADVMGFKFSGFFAWFIWRTIYASKIPGVQRKVRVVLHWTLDLFFPRDISIVRPESWALINNVRYDRDDVILNPNEPFENFYIIKQGRVEVWRNDQVIMTLETGDYIGGHEFAAKGKWFVKVVASEPCSIVSLSREVWTTMMLSRDFAMKFPSQGRSGPVENR